MLNEARQRAAWVRGRLLNGEEPAAIRASLNALGARMFFGFVRSTKPGSLESACDDNRKLRH